MKKFVSIIVFVGLSSLLVNQNSKSIASAPTLADIIIPMKAERWNFTPGAVEFVAHKGQPAMKIVNGANKVTLKDLVFSNGTIEFDLDPQDERFVGINFRMANDNEMENFYLRTARAGDPRATDAAQYAAYNKGVNLWDLLGHFQGPAIFSKGEWNHIKLVVSGKQLKVYVNNPTKPTLEIPRMEGNTNEGALAFTGQSILANLVVKPGIVEGLPAKEGVDPTATDERYIRMWQTTDRQLLAPARELGVSDLPKATSTWQKISAERRGLINLTRVYGGNETRRFVWLKTKLVTAAEQKRKISLGFSDEVWVFLNGQPVFSDKNIYVNPAMRKKPDGRISLENSQFDVTLKAGENELLIGVANDFFGWGIVARLDKVEGIVVK